MNKLSILTLAFAISSAIADPLLSSWFTENSGSYARIYNDATDLSNDVSTTTWSQGAGVQSLPTYAGIHELSYTDDWLYLRTTNLASYTMGPWFRNNQAANPNIFVNYPSNASMVYRLPRTPVVSSPSSSDTHTYNDKTLTTGGVIGYMVNGVSIYDSRDAFSYSNATGEDENGMGGGEGAWNSDAYVNESGTFDFAFAHAAGNNLHQHANPPALRHQLGDSVDYTQANASIAPYVSPYTENFNGEHSPIIGWMRDGLPLYGPYGYDDPMDSTSAPRRMISGFQLRTITVRSSWPAWATRLYAETGQSFANGPDVTNGGDFPLGQYLEDNEYKGDLPGMTLGIDFDLNEFNARFCKTPEFPNGTWAYFTCIESDGTPAFPYNIARAYLGIPTGGVPNTVPDTDDQITDHTIYFEGGPETEESMGEVLLDDPNSGDITVVWNLVEGGTYHIQESTDLGTTNAWEDIATDLLADAAEVALAITPAGGIPEKNFYRLHRSSLATFDDTGFQYETTATIGDPITINSTITSSGGNIPNNTTLPVSITFDGESIDIPASNVSRNGTDIQFDFTVFGKAPGVYTIEVTYENGTVGTADYTIEPNILLMIVDDWGIDRSPIDSSNAAETLPNMPHLNQLAAEGLQFTNAYAQPQCSPTRASIMTGRQPHQHNVGKPEDAGLFSTAEITLPEIFTLEGASHEMISVGKWHLGGNQSAYMSKGGWPEFYGIQNGAVGSYYAWDKNSNGTTTATTTYSTSDQVNEASTFIEAQTVAGKPWFAWVAFNAPHSPFQDPPADLAPVGGYSAQATGENTNSYNYRKSLEALDTEIGRLLKSIDPAQTQIIIIGDNGTPSSLVQAPYTENHAKSTLYQGGIRVPMVVKGPAVTVPPGTNTDKLVHCVDLFSTIIELVGINESTVTGLAAQNVLSQSIVPILEGTDTADRSMIAEVGRDSTTWGRAIILDDYPDYKLIVRMDPQANPVTTTYEFYKIDTDLNEDFDLGTPVSGTALDAYNACLAKDTALGPVYTP